MNVYEDTTPRERTEYRKNCGTNKTGFIGVKYVARKKIYQAYIRVPWRKNKIYCGQGKTAEDAAKKYDAKALELFGPDAVTNFDQNERQPCPT